MPPPNKDALWSSGKDETVEVNQRALIDKILARYSGEHTIFRELLQNADDAGAEHVQVKLFSQAGWAAHERGETSTSLPDAKRDPISRYVVSNDGIPFRTEDWHRLKKIAEGNPDEEKIFGVGFYSLWSVCDDPFVESGSKWMGFYWKDGKDQLVARSGDLPPNGNGTAVPEPSLTGNPWTTFTMALRDPTPFEAPLEFARFLVTSLTFMRTIKRIDLVVDDIKVLEVRKDIKEKRSVSRPGLNSTSAMGMMKVQSVDSTSMVITTRVMKWLSATGATPPPLPDVFSKPIKAAGGLLSSFFGRHTPAPSPEPPSPSPVNENPTDVDVMGREIHTFQADVKVSVSSSFSRELERATKKRPPARMPASLVFSREEESATAADGSSMYDKKAAVVFSGLCPPLDSDKSARVFIGQPTSQTTGIGGHMAARFIPTVERESVDLVDKHVSQWNKELLWVGGYLSRLIYEMEMADLKQQWSNTTGTETAARAQILARGLYALRFFTFRPTTPSAAVGTEMEAAFFNCARNNKDMPLVSTEGIQGVDSVRIPNDELLQFLPDLPVLTPATLVHAQRAVAGLQRRRLLHDIVFDDVVKQLHSRPLTEKEMIACLNWWQEIGGVDGYSPQVRLRLLQAAIVITDKSKIVPLAAVKTFINPSTSMIPTDMPLPTDTIPFSVTKNLKISTIHEIFGWSELSLPHYLDFLIKPPMTGTAGSDPTTDICVSAEFAERVLGVLGRAWPGMSAQKQQAITVLIKNVNCIPTKAGFKKPGEAYFEKNLLFDDLPTIAFQKTQIKGGLESMLLAIGVRRTVDLQLVFSRLIGGGSWTCLDLMKYLVSVKDSLSKEELARLRQTAAFPIAEPIRPDGTKAPVVRMKPNQLYEPTDTLRDMKLPLLEWPESKWRSNSDEARMLFDLGLRRFPPIDTLLGLAAGPEPTNRLAFDYLLNNISTHYAGFDPSTFGGIAFVPSTSATGNNSLSKPGEVFTNEDCKILGFSVARLPASLPANAAKLRIASDPPMPQLVAAFLKSPETDMKRARTIFEYLASRLGSAQVGAIGPLRSSAWIPVKTEDFRLARPDEVFLGKDKVDSLYASAFTFVDFGERANPFLHNVGVRSEPSHKDIAKLLLQDPDRMLSAGGLEKYLDQLRIIAAHVKSFDTMTIHQMKSTPFVIGSQLVLKDKRSGENDDDYRREWVLCKASDTVIMNNATYSHYFKQYITGAPEERMLETFYNTLGAQYIHTKVGLDYITSGIRPQASADAAASRRHILERLTIFLGQDGAKAKYTTEFISNHFEVIEANNIKARYTYRDGHSTHQHVETLYAIAEARGRDTVLTLSTTAPFDAYDIAYGLVRVLLKTHKTEDVLTLDAILSTPLPLLKKRGFNVDRLLNQQHEERLRLRADAQKDREAKVAAATALAETQRANTQVATSAGKDAMVPSPSPAGAMTTTTPEGGAGPKPDGGAGLRPDNGIMNVFRRFRSQGADTTRPPSIPDTTADKPPPPFDNKAPGGNVGAHGGGAGGPSRGPAPQTTTARPSDTAQIRNTARAAVQASKPGAGSMTIESTRRNTAVAPESQQQYCDPSAEANLRKAHSPGPSSCEIYLPIDQPGFVGDEFVISQRFVQHILLPLAGIFQLQPSVLRVFWDRSGPLIAFNRSGEIFCNARYYDAWHDAAVQHGDTTAALVSWYHSLAHELAHNLESQHNASHEFWFSSILEEYFVSFASLISSNNRLQN